MKNRTSTTKHRQCIRAFTLIECLISLAITAILMTAVAAAFKASIVSYGENEEIFWTVNNARQALARMTAQLRTAGYDDPTYGLVAVDPSDPNNRCSFRTADGGNFTYEFRSAENRICFINNTTNQTYVLCDDVVGASFTRTLPTDSIDCKIVKSVQISLTVRSGDSRRTLSAAAVIRRNLSH
ncbi:MAG TPA: prepilin-type N-terminal cleavage/methylation domain-containing protein [Sedimentisphaerales bacterium]|nr:prepilin-type N-terminal cleavage/methylation domain-containing protein [Sedimentisphaerales bacterium]